MPTGAHLIFDKYELVRRLAIGGMGEVFVARQVSDVAGFERPVILKSLLPDLARDPAFVEQFLDEARVAATLNHPNVVSVFEVGVSRGTYYIAMEFIPGVNLSQLRRAGAEANRPLSPYATARIIAEAAAGLHHAHSATDVNGQPLRLVHRDISPHNIMVRTDGLTKVVDFGIASAANRVTRTRTGTLKGKLAYMSPEQLRVRPLDGRSDQFSLGIVFWELLAQVRLFTGENDARIAAAVLQGAIEPPSRRGAPEALDAIVMRMLDRDPEQRFASCAAVEKALDEWLRTQTVPSDHAALAAYVREVGGEELREHSLSTPDDFVLRLRSQEPAVAPMPTLEISEGSIETSSLAPRRARSRVPLFATALLAFAAVGALFAWPRVSAPPLQAPLTAALPVAPDAGPAVVIAPIASPPDAGALAAALPKPKPTEPRRKPAAAAKKPPEEVQTAQGLLTVRTDPVADIYVDGHRRAKLGVLFKWDIDPGRHQLEFRTADGRTSRQEVVIVSGEHTKLDLKLDR